MTAQVQEVRGVAISLGDVAHFLIRVERFANLICPASGLPLRRKGDTLVAIDDASRYPIENGIPKLFVRHGFNSSFDAPASSRRMLANWEAQQGLLKRLIGRLVAGLRRA